MTPVFADTFCFIALLSPDDAAHERAVEYSHLIEQSVTTEWVLIELADGLADKESSSLQRDRDALLDDPPRKSFLSIRFFMNASNSTSNGRQGMVADRLRLVSRDGTAG